MSLFTISLKKSLFTRSLTIYIKPSLNFENRSQEPTTHNNKIYNLKTRTKPKSPSTNQFMFGIRVRARKKINQKIKTRYGFSLFQDTMFKDLINKPVVDRLKIEITTLEQNKLIKFTRDLV